MLLLPSVGRTCLHASTIAGVADGNMGKDSMVADAGTVSTVILANGVAVMPFVALLIGGPALKMK